MGWLSKAFGDVGDFIEDYGVPVIAGAALGVVTGGLGALAVSGLTGTIGGAATAGMTIGEIAGAALSSGAATTGALIGGASGLQQASAKKAEEAQQAQIAAAQRIADMQDPSRLVQQATAAPQVQHQQQVTEQNNATKKAMKFSLSKTTYSKGLATLGGGTSQLKDILG